jgi:hypothetical protein
MKALSSLLHCSAILAGAMTTHGAAVAYFTASGPQNMGTTGNWGTNSNRDADNAFELVFDFTTAVDTETKPILLWEAGGSGTGASLVMDGDELHFFAGNSNDDVVTGLHGLSAGTVAVQIVSVFDVDGGTAGDELLSTYVNGLDITGGGADAATANAWDGGEAFSDLGTKTIGSSYRYNSTTLFATGDVVGYDSTGETNISFAAYQLASGGGPADNTLANILVPEPSTWAVAGLGGIALLLRRRRD